MRKGEGGGKEGVSENGMGRGNGGDGERVSGGEAAEGRCGDTYFFVKDFAVWYLFFNNLCLYSVP